MNDDVQLMSIDEYRELKGRTKDDVKKIPDRWLRISAGVIMIISGIISFKYCSIFLTFMVTDTIQYDFCWLVFQLCIGIPTIVGGIAALTRRKYQYALAGAAVSIMTTIVLGVIALILLIMAQDEFEEYED